MGTSFVDIDDKGFWMRDGILELWLRLLALHIEDPTEPNSINAIIRNQWLLASRGFFTGCIPTNLDEAVATEEGKNITLNAINRLIESLKSGPDELDKDFLNILGFRGSWIHNFETARLFEVGQAFLDLIEGKIATDASDTSFMPGCKADK